MGSDLAMGDQERDLEVVVDSVERVKALEQVIHASGFLVTQFNENVDPVCQSTVGQLCCLCWSLHRWEGANACESLIIIPGSTPSSILLQATIELYGKF